MKRQWILTSVSALLVCCLFVFVPYNVFANDGTQQLDNFMFYLYPSGANSTSNSDLYASMLVSDCYGSFDGVYYNKITSSSNTYTFTSLTLYTSIKFIGKFVIRNTTSNDLIIPSTYIRLLSDFDASANVRGYVTDFKTRDGQLTLDRISNTGYFTFANSPDYSLYSNIKVPAHGDIQCIWEVTYSLYYTGSSSSAGTLDGTLSFTWTYPAIPISPIPVALGDALVSSYPEYLKWIYFRLNTIYDALIDNVQQGTATDTEAGDTQTEVEAVGGTQEQYFGQTETDLEAIGLGSFSFDTPSTGAITKVTSQFTYFWNRLGVLTLPVTTALSLKVATTVLRHMPRKRKEDD